VTSVREDKLPRRRASRASGACDPLERGTWHYEERANSVVSGRIELATFLSCDLRARQQLLKIMGDRCEKYSSTTSSVSSSVQVRCISGCAQSFLPETFVDALPENERIGFQSVELRRSVLIKASCKNLTAFNCNYNRWTISVTGNFSGCMHFQMATGLLAIWKVVRLPCRRHLQHVHSGYYNKFSSHVVDMLRHLEPIFSKLLAYSVCQTSNSASTQYRKP
jgi:hypothetical protein